MPCVALAKPRLILRYYLECPSHLSIFLPRRQLTMLTGKILNPHLLSLLARVRHTNAVVIADRGFPYWPEIETVDISLVDDVPTFLQLLAAARAQFEAAWAYMSNE